MKNRLEISKFIRLEIFYCCQKHTHKKEDFMSMVGSALGGEVTQIEADGEGHKKVILFYESLKNGIRIFHSFLVQFLYEILVLEKTI